MDTELLREAIRAAETHDWIKGQLMQDREGRLVFVSMLETLMARGEGVSYNEAEEIECDQVGACCAVGYLRFANLCLLPVRGTGSSADELQEQLERLLWARPEVRDACQRWLDGAEGWSSRVDIADHVEAEGLSAIGEEGLLPYWNDHIATSKDEVVALFTEALESITPA